MMDQQLVRPVRSRSSRGRKAKHRICRRHVDLRRNHRPTRRLLQDAHMAVLLCYVDPVLSIYETNNATAQANVAKPNPAAESRRPH